MKRLLPVGHEKVPRGLGLRTGDRGNTADGSGNSGRPASWAQTTEKNQELAEPRNYVFPKLQYP